MERFLHQELKDLGKTTLLLLVGILLGDPKNIYNFCLNEKIIGKLTVLPAGVGLLFGDR